MEESRRIGILLFLYTRDELSPAEQEELRSWRNQDPENEKLFFQMTDPDSLRLVMQEYYEERDRDFEKLKNQIPQLSETWLTGSIDEAKRIFSETNVLEDDQAGLFEDEYAGSGLSPVEYWNSMISRLDDAEQSEGETKNENKVVPITRRTIKSRLRIKNRLLRYLARVAAIVIVMVIINYFTIDKRYKNYKAEMVSSDGIKTMLEDFDRGYEAGKAGIKIEYTDKGEPIYIAANEHRAKKDKTYSLHTAAGGEFILKLPDGTMIWMNAASRITYPANFDQDTIRIEVEGEVYIQKSKDSTHHILISRPTVNSQLPTIQLQPSSNLDVNSYTGHGELTVTLIHGAAALRLDTTKNEILLAKGEQASIIPDMITAVHDVDSTEVIAWKNGQFDYKDVSLAIMMPAIGKWYDLEIQYASQSLDKKFTLQMPRSAPISEVFDNLRKQGLHITYQGKTITIWK